MANTRNTSRTTETKALRNRAETAASNQQLPVAPKVERGAEVAPWVGNDNLIDGVHTPSVNEAPSYSDRFHDLPADDYSVDNPRGVDNSQAKMAEARENGRKSIPAEWGVALNSQKTVVRGYRAKPEAGEHKVRLVTNGDEYPKFFASTERYGAFMLLLLQDQRSSKQWEAGVKLSDVGSFQQNVANENGGLNVGMTLEELLDTLTKTPFRCWTLIDPEKDEKHCVRTFFSGEKYTQVFNAIERKQKDAAKQEADRK